MNMQLMMARARMNHIPAPVGNIRRWWRIMITGEASSGSNVTVFEMTIRATAGGQNLATGGLAAASSTYSSSFVAAFAFDGNTNSRWAAKGTDPLPYMLAYRLTSASAVNEISIMSHLSGFSNWPTSFVVQSSADSTTGLDGIWSDEWTVTGQTTWGVNEVRVFTRP